jgi:GTP-binding protein
VINKKDLLPAPEADQRARAIVRALRYKGPHFLISGATGEGTKALCESVMTFLEADDRSARERASSPEDTGAAPRGAA